MVIGIFTNVYVLAIAGIFSFVLILVIIIGARHEAKKSKKNR